MLLMPGPVIVKNKLIPYCTSIMSASAVFQCTLKLCKQLDSFNCATMATIQNQVMLLFLASRGPCLAKLMRIPSNQEIKLFLNNYKLF